MPRTSFHAVTLSSLRFPNRICQSAWLEHGPFAFWLVEQARPRTVVELGTYRGFSYCCFCQAIAEGGLKARASAIDTWRGDEHAGFFDDEVLIDLRKHHDARYGHFSSLIRSTFDEAVQRFEESSIDLLHIDGRHFYEDVRHDFETWLPKLSDRAVVLFHDIAVDERGFGVVRFWSEIAPACPSFSFFHGYGLGVLSVGKNAPEAVLALCRSPEAEASEIRAAYARLGRDVSSAFHEGVDPRPVDTGERAQLQRRLLEAERSNAGLVDQLLALEASNTELRRDMASARFLFRASWKKIVNGPRDALRKIRHRAQAMNRAPDGHASSDASDGE